MPTIPGFPKLSEASALERAKGNGHRFTVDPRRASSGGDIRHSWRCLDCEAMLIVYHLATGYAQARCLGADGSALTRSCNEVPTGSL
jgi:hypothetical protein